MSAEGGGGGQMVVNRATISTWETFKVSYILRLLPDDVRTKMVGMLRQRGSLCLCLYAA